MSLLNEQLAYDSASFIDTDAFGEAITYKPNGAANVALNAVVHRLGEENLLHIRIANHATLGRTSIDTGGDRINVAARYGGTAADHIVSAVLEQDAGTWLLQVGG